MKVRLVRTASIVVAAATAMSLASCGDDTTPATTGTAASPHALSTSRWWMTSVSRNGSSVLPKGDRTVGGELRFLAHVDCKGLSADLCYSGQQMVGSDGCNGVSKKVTIDATEVHLDGDFGMHTLMACSGPFPDTLDELFRSPSLRFSIRDGHLRLTSPSGDIVVTYDALTASFGPANGVVVDDGSNHTPPYRLVWNQGLSLEMRDDVNSSTGGAGVGADPGRVNAMRVPVGDREYLFGMLPVGTARAVYEPRGGAARDVKVHDVAGTNSKVVGEFVDGRSNGWKLTAYDATGRVIHTLDWSPTPSSSMPAPAPPPTS